MGCFRPYRPLDIQGRMEEADGADGAINAVYRRERAILRERDRALFGATTKAAVAGRGEGRSERTQDLLSLLMK